jgi:hypothetical protein
MSDLSTFTSSFFPFFAAFFAAFFAIFLILPGFVICAFPFATSSVSSCTTTCANLAHVCTAASLSREAVFTAPACSSLTAWKSGRQLVPCLQPPVVRGAAAHRLVRHRDICTWPVWWRLIARAAAGDKSSSRPWTKGPRSLIRTVTHPSWQTLTSVPKGSERCAAVIAEQSKRSPLAVR